MDHPDNWISNTGRPIGGPTVVLDLDVPANEQSPGCFHVFEANGAGAVVPMTITATMTWDIWALTSSRPTERLITPVTRQTTFVVDVRELQAVID